jgi:hypothetical protein
MTLSDPNLCKHKQWNIFRASGPHESGIVECVQCGLHLTQSERLNLEALKKQNTFFWITISIAILSAIASITASYRIPAYLTEQQNKQVLIQNLTRIGQTQIYGAQRYWFDVNGKEDSQIISAAWQNYINASFSSNESNILTPMFLEYYFHDKAGRSDYEQNIIPAFAKLHDDLLNFKEKGTTNVDINSEIEDVRAAFNRFVSKLLGI